jgi:predicted amidophosphoribosyltransferase
VPSDPTPKTDPAAPGAQRLESGGFLWPPAPLPDPSATTILPTPPPPAGPLRAGFAAALARRRTTRARLLDACEDHWLDLTTPSLARRAAEAGWFPDLPGDYCPRCGVSAERNPIDALGCDACTSRRLPYEKLIRLGSFRGLLRDAVHELKFEQQRATGRRLGRLLGLAIMHELTRAGISAERVVLIPVPTTFRRRMHRGIDHTLILARSVQQITGGVIARPIRKRHRPSQVEVNPSQREANMARAFRPGPSPLTAPLWGNRSMASLSGKVLIVLDDVTTTGATLRGACRAVLAGWRQTCRTAAGSGGGGHPGVIQQPRVWAAVLGVSPGADGSPPADLGG